MKTNFASVGAVFLLASTSLVTAGSSHISNMKEYANGSGTSQSFSSNGALDTRNPFFQNLGSNGRSCTSCHQPDQGWSVTPAGIQQRFEATGGGFPRFLF